MRTAAFFSFNLGWLVGGFFSRTGVKMRDWGVFFDGSWNDGNWGFSDELNKGDWCFSDELSGGNGVFFWMG